MKKATKTINKNGIESNEDRKKYLESKIPGKPLPMNFFEKLLIRAKNLGKEAAYIGRVLSENPYPRLKQEDPGFLISQAEYETWKLSFCETRKEIIESGYNPKTGDFDKEVLKEKERIHKEKMFAYYNRLPKNKFACPLDQKK